MVIQYKGAYKMHLLLDHEMLSVDNKLLSKQKLNFTTPCKRASDKTTLT